MKKPIYIVIVLFIAIVVAFLFPKLNKDFWESPYIDLDTAYTGPAQFIDENGKFGFTGKDGQVIIQPQFDDTIGFSDGIAGVMIGEKWGFIDETGNMIIKPQFDQVEYFSDGLAGVMVGEKWGFIDETGNMIIKPQFDEIDSFASGQAGIRIGKKWGYIDKTGNIIFEPRPVKDEEKMKEKPF